MLTYRPVNTWTCWPTDLSAPGHVDPQTCQHLDMLTHRPVNTWTCWPTDLSTVGHVDPQTCLPLDMLTLRPVYPWTCWTTDLFTLGHVEPQTCLPLNMLTHRPVNPWTNWPIGLPLDKLTHRAVNNQTCCEHWMVTLFCQYVNRFDTQFLHGLDLHQTRRKVIMLFKLFHMFVFISSCIPMWVTCW